MHSPLFSLSVIFTFFLSSSSTATYIHHHRRLLHQPLYPLFPPSSVPSNTKPPVPSPNILPFFFPFPPPPPPPPTLPDDLATFPANISSLTLPHSSHSSRNSITSKFIGILILVSVLSTAFITALVLFLFLYSHRHHEDKSYDHERTDSLRLVPPNTTPSHAKSSPREANEYGAQSSTAPYDSTPVNYQRAESPELCPFPPLPRQSFIRYRNNKDAGSFEEVEEEDFFSPSSSNFMQRSFHAPFEGSLHNQNQYMNSNSSNDSLLNSPSGEFNYSPTSSTFKSPDTLVNFSAPKRFILPPMGQMALSSSSLSSGSTHNSPSFQMSDSSMHIPGSSTRTFRNSERYVSIKLPLLPPLPPRPRFWEASRVPEPQVVEKDGQSMPVLLKNANVISESSEAVERRNEESMKPKLKPLHWDKVRAWSDRAMVWDQLKSSSSQ